MNFRIRDLLWLALAVALLTSWTTNHRRQQQAIENLRGEIRTHRASLDAIWISWSGDYYDPRITRQGRPASK